MSVPAFKYHPDPIASRVFEPSNAPCPVCGQARGYSYVGPRYTVHDVEHLCAACIADGSASARFDIEFVDPLGPEDVNDDTKRDELLHRTPGYFSAQGDRWPAHCGDFCALVGPVKWDGIEPLRQELEADLQRLCADLGLTQDELVRELSRDASPLWAHLFKCLSCAQHRLVADYE